MASIFRPSTWFGSNSVGIDDPTPRRLDYQGSPGPSRGILARIRDALGMGYVGPRLSAGTRQERWITEEKAASGPRNVVLPWFLPYFEDYTRETSAMRLAYRYMLSSPVIKSALFGKLFGVASLTLKMMPPDKKNQRDKAIAKHVEWILNERLHEGIAGLSWSVLSGGLVDGYSICEKIWALENKGRYAGKYSLSRLKPKDVGNDVVLQTDEFRNVVGVMGLRYNSGMELSPADFLIYRHMPMYDSPTGMSDLRAVYGSWWTLDTVRKLRSIHAEKHAIPMLLGSYQNASVKNSLEAALMKAKSQRWISVPEAAKVMALEMAGSAAAEFEQFEQRLIHEIYLGIQYAVLQALEGETTDGRGNSQVHQSTADLARWFLANSVEHLLNDRDCGLVKDIVDLNYVVSEYPTAKLSAVDVNELAQEMSIDTGLKALGWKFSLDEVAERYGRMPPEDSDDEMKPPDSPPPSSPSSAADRGAPLPFDDTNSPSVSPKATPLGGGGRARPFRGQRFSEAWQHYLAN